MDVLIMGAGALGSVIGGFMAQAGHRVSLVGRREHMDAIAEKGLRITGIWGEHRIREQLNATDNLEALPSSGSWDVVFITVKSYDTAAAIDALTPRLTPHTLVCSYQNGLGNGECIAERIGWEQTIGARAIFGAKITEPGEVAVTVIAQPTALGCLRPGPDIERIQALANAMDEAGVPTVYTDKLETLLWAKVAYNSALNPLSALLDVPYGAVGEAEETRAIVAEVVAELYAVGQARGVTLQPETPAAFLELFYEKLLPPTAAHYASMREDLLRGRRTEIDALNGAIVGFGEAIGLDCPTNRLLTRLIHAREQLDGKFA